MPEGRPSYLQRSITVPTAFFSVARSPVLFQMYQPLPPVQVVAVVAASAGVHADVPVRAEPEPSGSVYRCPARSRILQLPIRRALDPVLCRTGGPFGLKVSAGRSQLHPRQASARRTD